jgi:hypothetical protein
MPEASRSPSPRPQCAEHADVQEEGLFALSSRCFAPLPRTGDMPRRLRSRPPRDAALARGAESATSNRSLPELALCAEPTHRCLSAVPAHRSGHPISPLTHALARRSGVRDRTHRRSSASRPRPAPAAPPFTPSSAPLPSSITASTPWIGGACFACALRIEQRGPHGLRAHAHPQAVSLCAPALRPRLARLVQFFARAAIDAVGRVSRCAKRRTALRSVSWRGVRG